MASMKDWHPLSDIWDTYEESIDQAVSSGLLDDDDVAEQFVWPADLSFGDYEQEDVKKYVHERMTEIVDRVRTQGGVDPNLVAGYIFRSVLCGMMFQKERTGK